MARILVIDDDDEIRSVLHDILAREGYNVVVASNGKEGIELYREDPTDLIITDLIMPEKEGIETILELKQDFPDLRFIAISGGGRIDAEDYLDLAQKLGARRTLAKPFKRDALLRSVEDALEVQQA